MVAVLWHAATRLAASFGPAIAGLATRTGRTSGR